MLDLLTLTVQAALTLIVVAATIAIVRDGF